MPEMICFAQGSRPAPLAPIRRSHSRTLDSNPHCARQKIVHREGERKIRRTVEEIDRCSEVIPDCHESNNEKRDRDRFEQRENHGGKHTDTTAAVQHSGLINLPWDTLVVSHIEENAHGDVGGTKNQCRSQNEGRCR